MIVRIGLGPRLPGTSEVEFLAHWTNGHAVLGSKLVGLRRYVQNRPIPQVARPWLLPPPAFDYCSEVEFDTFAAMNVAFESNQYRAAVFADELALIDHSRQSRVTAERVVLLGGSELSDPVKLITFVRLHPASTSEELVRCMSGAYARLVAGSSPQRHELLVALTGIDVGHPQACDVVDEIWFESRKHAASYLRSGESQRAAGELEGRAFGTVRFLCNPVTIVDNVGVVAQ